MTTHAIVLMNQSDICICYRYASGFNAFKLNGAAINATCDSNGLVTITKNDNSAFTATVLYT